jgi:hypothetical protein
MTRSRLLTLAEEFDQAGKQRVAEGKVDGVYGCIANVVYHLRKAAEYMGDPADMLREAMTLLEGVQEQQDCETSAVAVRAMVQAKGHLQAALDKFSDTRTEAERRADWEADRADDAISSGEVEPR